MLLKFAVTNFKSFKYLQEFDLSASARDEYVDSLYQLDDGIRANSTACIIGPNGSGKTHLLNAIECFATAIESVNGVEQAFQPYCLDSESAKKPTEYEVLLFDKASQCYLNYAFAVLKGKVTSEQLHVKSMGKKARERKVFERKADHLSFSTKYAKQELLLKDTISDGGLILNYANSIKLDELAFVHQWASRVLLFDFDKLNKGMEKVIEEIFLQIDGDHDEASAVMMGGITNMAKKLGFPIKEFYTLVNESNETQLMFSIQTFDKTQMNLNFNEAKSYFSEGSWKAINLLIALFLFSHTSSGYTILIDEFDSSFHHKLSEAMLGIIREIKNDKTFSQVIFTTHDVLLLDKGFRRDSIHVLEKDEVLSTVIHRADKFALRKDAKLSLKYLNNEFGALPKILSDN